MMPRRKYSPKQAAALALVAEIHAEEVNAKLTLRREIERAFEERLMAVKLRKSQAMNAARNLEVAKTDLGRAIHTSNWETIETLLELTRGDATAEDLDPLAERYSLAGDVLTIHLEPTDAPESWDAAGLAEHARTTPDGALDLTTATFTVERVAYGRVFIDPTPDNPLWLADYGVNHPVVHWLIYSADAQAEAREWWEAHS